MIAIVILVLLIVVGILVEIYRSSDISNHKTNTKIQLTSKDMLICISVIALSALLIGLCESIRWAVILLLPFYLMAHKLIITYRDGCYSHQEEIQNSRTLGWVCCLPVAIIAFVSYFYSWMFIFAYIVFFMLPLAISDDSRQNIEGTATDYVELSLYAFGTAILAIIPYMLFQVWWFLLGDDYFNGGLFALAETPSELFCYTIMLLVIILYFASFFILKK